MDSERTFSAHTLPSENPGKVEGVEILVKETERLQRQYPTRHIYPSTLLWNGDNITGYHVSRLISVKIKYKERVARYWCISHCVIKNGVIIREWSTVDNKSLQGQLGMDSRHMSRKWAEQWLGDKMDPGKSETSHLSWLAAEFQRVQNTQKIVDNFHINLHNVGSAVRPLYEFIARRVAGLYQRCWGKEGMWSRDNFQLLIKELYHPLARYESPQTYGSDLTGWEDLYSLYDTFVFGNKESKGLAISLDWIILSPGDDTRKVLSNGAVHNCWRYPFSTDIDRQLELEKHFVDSDLVSESFTMAIRWTLAGYLKQADPSVLVPVVLMAESHLECAGFRIIREITVYDSVAVDAQIQLTTEIVHDVLAS